MSEPVVSGDNYERDLEQQFNEAFARLAQAHPSITMEISMQDLLIVISQIQLALRRPANAGPSAERARAILDDWLNAVEQVEPFVANMLRRGNDPRFDVKVGPE